jgi:aconitate hydratase
VYDGNETWNAVPVSGGSIYEWSDESTYIQEPPFFVGMAEAPGAIHPIRAARCLVSVGDSVTTDHISPAGSIKAAAPAGKYLVDHGLAQKDFNS